MTNLKKYTKKELSEFAKKNGIKLSYKNEETGKRKKFTKDELIDKLLELNNTLNLDNIQEEELTSNDTQITELEQKIKEEELTSNDTQITELEQKIKEKESENDTMLLKQMENLDISKPTLSYLTLQKLQKFVRKEEERDIWENSPLKPIKKLDSDSVGKFGEQILQVYCDQFKIPCIIDGTKTKQIGGGIGDGIINKKTIEIKTARQGSSGGSFQHELAEKPWKTEYMCFMDFSPDKVYITIFKNWKEDFYRKSGLDSNNKCEPYFPTKSITWRKKSGAFKLDTTVKINNNNIKEGHCITVLLNQSSEEDKKVKKFLEKIFFIKN